MTAVQGGGSWKGGGLTKFMYEGVLWDILAAAYVVALQVGRRGGGGEAIREEGESTEVMWEGGTAGGEGEGGEGKAVGKEGESTEAVYQGAGTLGRW